mmetsp:Transcript_60338/g.142391  ORF Transcript_60338/g.142391 Transcript_60338/m.142391 type:complete len:262 (-) Transcript_60338:1544-2329(-)
MAVQRCLAPIEQHDEINDCMPASTAHWNFHQTDGLPALFSSPCGVAEERIYTTAVWTEAAVCCAPRITEPCGTTCSRQSNFGAHRDLPLASAFRALCSSSSALGAEHIALAGASSEVSHPRVHCSRRCARPRAPCSRPCGAALSPLPLLRRHREGLHRALFPFLSLLLFLPARGNARLRQRAANSYWQRRQRSIPRRLPSLLCGSRWLGQIPGCCSESARRTRAARKGAVSRPRDGRGARGFTASYPGGSGAEESVSGRGR